ncbi:hypothetical protein HYS50_00140 [Candidatus Woesearchaeota archaeon]|nr:hypothetical protein [Candidatus Woesearchaeota archaeon]
MIIGLLGLQGSGKTTVTHHIEKKGFAVITLAEKEPETDTHALKLSSEQNYVIDHISTSQQMEFFKEKDDLILVKVDAPSDIRLERLIELRKQQEQREYAYDEVLTFEHEILTEEEPRKEQLVSLSKKANIILRNDQDLETLYKKIDRMMTDISKKFTLKKPSDDSFYMEIAQVVAKKSRCLKRKVGAVLVKNKRILALGFDDTPRHIRHCNENGCPACNQGDLQSPCLCNHAEENVIIQAAYHGISTQEATVYTTDSPCVRCTQTLINAGITELMFNEDIPLNDTAYSLLKTANITVRARKLT